MILEDEIIDDLQIKNCKIIQKKSGFKFGIDAVLLANFVKCKKNETLADLGTGTGVIPILVKAKSNIGKIYAIEIQEHIADMAKRSMILNNFQDEIEVVNINLKDSLNFIAKNSIDIITTNPPYMPKEKLLSGNQSMMISRNEIFCNIGDIMKISGDLLKSNGKMYMIHRPSRLSDIIYEGRKNNLEVKEMQMIYPSVGKSANMVLLKLVKNAKPEIQMLSPLFVHEADGRYTQQVQQIYEKKELEAEI